MNSRKQNNSDDLENLYSTIRNDGIKIIFYEFGKNLNFATNMPTRIWNLLLRTAFKITIFIRLFRQDTNQQQLPCTITTVTQNQLKYIRKKNFVEGVIYTENLLTPVPHRKSEHWQLIVYKQIAVKVNELRKQCQMEQK